MGNCAGANRTENPTDISAKLLIKTSTWVRDSHELFDYESPHLMKKSFKVQNSNGIVREDTEINILSDKDIHNQNFLPDGSPVVPQKIVPILNISSYKGVYSIFDVAHKLNPISKKAMIITPFPQPFQPPGGQDNQKSLLNQQSHQQSQSNEDQDSNKLWLIVRYMTIDGKSNQFKLTGGETIKLGRVKFTVREIQSHDDENKTDYDSFENNQNIDENAEPALNHIMLDRDSLQLQQNNRQSQDVIDYQQQMVEDEEEKVDLLEGYGQQFLISQENNNQQIESQLLSQVEEEKGEQVKGEGQTNTLKTIRNRLTRVSQGDNNENFCNGEQDSKDKEEFKDAIDNQQDEILDEENQGIQDDGDGLSMASAKDSVELQKTILTNNNQSENQSLCRICFSENNTSDNPLINPCKCSGTLKFIHLECLRTWLSRKENVKTNNSVISYSWKAFHCELCKTEYNDRLMHEGRLHWLFEISKPKSNYIILESVQMQGNQNVQNHQSKTLHVINLNQKQTIKIGRGHDNDLRVADISVSRCHSLIKKDSKGNIVIEDNSSKFGTLIQVKAPLILYEQLIYYIQAGRTIMKLQLSTEWSLFGGLMKANFNKKYDIEDDFKNPEQTGDPFYDFIGRFCNGDSHKQIHQTSQQQQQQSKGNNSKEESKANVLYDEDMENVNESISYNNQSQEYIEDENEINLQRQQNLSPQRQQRTFNNQRRSLTQVRNAGQNAVAICRSKRINIQEIKTNSFRIKLTSLKQKYSNQKMESLFSVPALVDNDIRSNKSNDQNDHDIQQEFNLDDEERRIEFNFNNKVQRLQVTEIKSRVADMPYYSDFKEEKAQKNKSITKKLNFEQKGKEHQKHHPIEKRTETFNVQSNKLSFNATPQKRQQQQEQFCTEAFSSPKAHEDENLIQGPASPALFDQQKQRKNNDFYSMLQIPSIKLSEDYDNEIENVLYTPKKNEIKVKMAQTQILNRKSSYELIRSSSSNKKQEQHKQSVSLQRIQNSQINKSSIKKSSSKFNPNQQIQLKQQDLINNKKDDFMNKGLLVQKKWQGTNNSSVNAIQQNTPKGSNSNNYNAIGRGQNVKPNFIVKIKQTTSSDLQKKVVGQQNESKSMKLSQEYYQIANKQVKTKKSYK